MQRELYNVEFLQFLALCTGEVEKDSNEAVAEEHTEARQEAATQQRGRRAASSAPAARTAAAKRSARAAAALASAPSGTAKPGNALEAARDGPGPRGRPMRSAAAAANKRLMQAGQR
jgi:hypothetical protein